MLDAVVGLTVAAMLAVVAYFIDYGRMYFYAIIIGVAIPGVKVIEKYVGNPLDHILVFGIPAAAIFATGLITFLRFLEKYPRASEDMAHD